MSDRGPGHRGPSAKRMYSTRCPQKSNNKTNRKKQPAESDVGGAANNGRTGEERGAIKDEPSVWRCILIYTEAQKRTGTVQTFNNSAKTEHAILLLTFLVLYKSST